MEYPLILRTEDGSEICVVEDAEQEAAAAPKYRRRSMWNEMAGHEVTASVQPEKRKPGRPKKVIESAEHGDSD